MDDFVPSEEELLSRAGDLSKRLERVKATLGARRRLEVEEMGASLEALLGEIHATQGRMQEMEETLSAIRSGEVDAVVVQGPKGERIYTLKGAEERYRVMVEQMSEGALAFSPDGTILYGNQRFADMLGVPLEETIGTSLLRFVPPEESGMFRTLMAQSREAVVHSELNLRAAGGVLLPVNFSAAPLLEEEPEAVAAVVTDLSRLVAMTEALRESEDKFRYVFEHSPIGKSLTFADGTLHVNQAFCDMLGYTAQEMHGRKWQDVTHPDDLADNLRLCDTLLTGGPDATRFVKRYLDKSGRIVWGDVSTALRRDANGKPLYFITHVIDITERKRAEDELQMYKDNLEDMVRKRTAELEAANKELEGFAYSVSHDLRTPLRAIDGFSHMLQDLYKDKLDDEGQRLLSVVRGNAQRMAKLIDDILAFSRMGRVDMWVAEVDMDGLVRSVVEELRPTAAGRDLDIAIGALPPAKGDSSMLRQVWSNLLSNAIKFTGPKKTARIEIGGSTEGEDHVYYVKDNGVGFDMQYADKLFGVFQRLHGVDEFDGTGIGLAIARRIVTRHGGRIWAESRVDEGAEFRFALPVVPAVAPKAAPAVPPQS
ncbi:MAG TPA: PAS domain S-box protein [Noviherbaspirillum sp.]